MTPSTAVLLLVTLTAGAGGGWAAYEFAAVAGEPTETTATTAVADEPPATEVRGTRVRWAPCQPPAELHGSTCVTSVVRTVVLSAPAAAPVRSAATLAAARVTVPAPPAYGGDDEAVGHIDDGGHEDED